MSSINPNNIDGTYPIAGQDNDSQGFRDNFTNIKNNLTFTKTELEDLQSKVILKNALLGTTLDNNLNNAIIKSAQLVKTTETVNDLGIISATTSTVSWNDGHFQFFTLNANTTLTFADWPTSSLYTTLRLQITCGASNQTLTFNTASSNFVGIADIVGASGDTITLTADQVYLFEFSTYNAGADIIIQDLLRNYTSEVTGFDALQANTATIISTTASTSTTTGALIVGGGVGVAGNVYANVFYGNVTGDITGNVTGTVTGDVAGNLTGNVTGTVLTGSQPSITSLGTLTGLAVNGTITAVGSGTVGYGAGAGGTVAQGSASGKATTVALNKPTGTITMDGAALAGNSTIVSFTLTNSTITATDIILVQHQSGGTLGAYFVTATPGAGSAQIYVNNVAHVNLSEAIVLRFAVVKSVNA